MNAIYIRRRAKVILPTGTGTTPITVLATFQKNIENLGFLLSDRVVEQLKLLAPTQVDAFYKRLVKELQSLVGAHRKYVPFYPKFPDQVMSMSEASLYFNAMLHYMTGFRLQSAPAARPVLDAKPKYRVLDLGTKEDFEAIFTLLVTSKTPYSPQDKDDVKWFVTQYREHISRLLPDAIPCKENLAYLGTELLRNAPAVANILDKHIKTATDVLRLAVALSDGDVSLATACKFGKFNRKIRATMLGWLERSNSRTEDMLRWKPRWVRLGERLHPGEYATRFPLTATAFDVLRNNRKFETFNSKIEANIAACDTNAVAELLETRPGEFARRLDHLSRIAAKPQSIATQFAAHAGSVSTPVLLQVMTHFQHRQDANKLRVFFPKGEVAKLFATETPLPQLPVALTEELAMICERTLVARFAKLPPLGNCYLDSRLKDYLVPFSQRSASKSLRTLVRGSRLPLPDCSTLRFFVWWKNGNSRVDIDLSAAMYDTNYQYISTLAYYNLKNFGAYHSGDITDAPKGAAEFIDVDRKLCVQTGVRYIVMSLSSFTQQPYCDLPECFAGWMARKVANSGEIFEPKTVVDKVDIAANAKMCLPAIFDLANGEVIWADIGLATHPRFANNVANHLSGVSLMLRSLTQLRKTNLHTLFSLHISARGQEVDTLKNAQTVFAVDTGITPFDLDKIGAEFL